MNSGKAPSGNVTSTKTNNHLVFRNQDGEEIGVLDFHSACLAFDGNAEASAVVFMEQVGNLYQHRLRQEYSKGYRAGRAFTEGEPKS